MSALCVVCQRTDPADGLTVCSPCMGRTDDSLARLVELTAEAAGWLERRATTGAGVRSVPGSRPPLSIDALDLALGLGGGIVDPHPRDGHVDPRPAILETLESWERMTREHFGLGPYGPASLAHGATVKGIVGFLRSWLFGMAEDATYPLDDLAREVDVLRRDAERLDPDRDRPDGMRVTCPEPHPDEDGRTCGYRLLILGATLSQDIECRRCGHVTTGGRMILSALADPTMTVWAYPDVIEDTLGIPSRTLRHWAGMGAVARLGSRYDVGAAYRLRHYAAG